MLEQILEQGTQFLQKFRFREAEESFRAALKENPESVQAHVQLTRILLLRNATEEANAAISRVMAVEPQNADLLMLQGICLMQEGALQHAVNVLEKASQLNAQSPAIYSNLARCYRKLNRVEEAEIAVQKSISLDADNFRSHFELAGVYAKKKMVVECVQEIIKCVRLNPWFVPGYAMLGGLYERLGKYDEAIQIYSTGIKRVPLAFPLREGLCRAHALKQDYESAYQQAVQLVRRRNFYGDYLRLGSYAIAIGQLQIAEKAFQKALELNPQSWEAEYDLAELYCGAGFMEKASTHYRNAIEKNENHFKPHNGLGLLLLKENNYTEAKKHFERAHELSPLLKGPLFNLALLCAASGEVEEAMNHLDAVEKLTGESEPLCGEIQRLRKEVEKQLPSKPKESL